MIQNVKSTFEKHREKPDTSFEESYFLDFLVSSSKSKGSFRNSFKALKRFNAFIDEIQLTYVICFSQKDRETDFSLSAFVSRIEQLQKSKRSSLASLRNQMKTVGVESNFIIISNLLLLLPIALSKNNYFLLSTFATLILLLNCWFIKVYIQDKKYKSTLLAKINELGANGT